ncbi:MAG TPA: MgtC/SapB family protein [Candidatus Baltobacteraceae bacterium]|nr:MgtC/SapB family protein [Candidatus Baltobacteraceae bacterium]
MKAPEITLVDFVTRLGAAAVLGIAIGFERQWRQRSAGLHTSSLVAIGASLFALLDTMMNAGDTTRIVAGVVTGVGFIAGGVILKSGSNISGLNTAATMWATAAVGALAGFGLWWESTAAAATIVVLNLVLQPVADAIDARAKHMQKTDMQYRLTVVCAPDSQSSVSRAILQTISSSDLMLQSLTKTRVNGAFFELVADIVSPRIADETLEQLSEAALAIAGVKRSDWSSDSAGVYG